MAEIEDFLSSKAEAQLEKYEKKINELVKLYEKIEEGAKQLDKAQQSQSKTQKELDSQTAEYNKMLKQLDTVSGKLEAAESDLNEELIRQKQALADANKAVREKIKLEDSEEGSINQLIYRNKKLREERNKLSTATEAGRQRIAAINREIEENTETIRENSSEQEQNRMKVGNYTSALDKIQGVFLKVTGAIAAASGALRISKEVIESTQVSGDAFAMTVEGMKQGWEAFKKSIATGDFANLIDNIKRANAAGRAYAATLDDLGDRRRDLTITEKEAKLETEKLKQVVDNVNLSDQERIKAAEQLIQKENDLADQRRSIAKQQLEAETDLLTSLTGLSEKEAITFMKNYDEQKNLREQAIKLIEKEDEVTKNKAKSVYQSNYEMQLQAQAYDDAVKDLAEYNKQLGKNKTAISQYATIFRKYGKTTDDELDRVVAAYGEYYDAQTSFYTQTRRSKNQLNSLIASITGEQEAMENNTEAVNDNTEAKRENMNVMDSLYDQELKTNEKTIDSANEKAKAQMDTIKQVSDAQVEAYLAEQARIEFQKQASINAAANVATAVANSLGETTAAGKVASIATATIEGYIGVQRAFNDPSNVTLFQRIAAAAAAASFAIANVRNIMSVDTYATGTENSTSTFIAGEAGRELMVDKKGNVMMVNEATLFQNSAGSKIYNNRETEQIMKSGGTLGGREDLSPIVNAIRQNRSVQNVSLDKHGIITVSGRSAAKTKYINRKFRHKA